MRKGLALVAIVLVVAAGLLWFLSAPSALNPNVVAEVSLPGDAEAGRLVFFAGGCESCHMTPGQEDTKKLGGGLPLKTPFGTFYPPNISPDANDGIGTWKPEDFATALLLGVSPKGAHYYPAFPYGSYRWMKAKDVRDLFAFLRTLPPVVGRPPRSEVDFPFDIRRAIGLWKFWYLADLPARDGQNPAQSWSLGHYLVEGPGHCGECHSPRDVLGGIIASRRFGGAALLDGKGKAPALTRAGLADWSKTDISDALSSGFTPSGDTLGGAMAGVVRNTAQLPPAYRDAIAAYLKDENK
jgi:mono/diheme cytochrome c family protein